MQLSSEIIYLPTVGPKKAAVLTKELKIVTVGDLLEYYPYKYVDRTTFYTIAELNTDMPYVQIRARLMSFSTEGMGRKLRLTALVADETGTLELVWFQGVRYIEDRYRVGQNYIIFGKPSRFGGHLNIVHPEMELLTENNISNHLGLQGFYNTSDTMKKHYINSSALRKMIWIALNDNTLLLPETLPLSLVRKFRLMSRAEAIHNIHFPKNAKLLQAAKRRLKFEELFFIQLHLLQQTALRNRKSQGYVLDRVGKLFHRFYQECLPFTLTGAQKRVIKEIRADLLSGRQMNRLLQGDVGSGKTMVALLTALIAIDNGFQACIMAPTEILATQHFKAISEQTRPIGLNVRLLTGSTPKKERATITRELQSGALQLLIGTHALIEDTVQFRNLGFAVIDEQHRFGVAQRAKLWAKNVLPPHVLVMTATPIPRTLAMTLYGDLSVSVIDELPPGRKPIVTQHLYENRRQQLYAFMRKQVNEGRQIYMVYPLIQESEKMDLKNLEDGYAAVSEAFSDLHVGMVHGKMKPAAKEAQMRRFVNGETQILMATTVIEVGVNVPNASVMVIENAERFGLAQLHQLRGRVGRGADQSYCILMSAYKITTETRKRLQIMVDSNDGFAIAEADLQMRGPGDIEGTIQSGLPFNLHIADLAHDGIILETARNEAASVLETDPDMTAPEHASLAAKLQQLRQTDMNWGAIS